MKLQKILLIILIFMIGMIGFVSAIQCSDADYDKDGDVDSLDLIQFRSCYNKEFTNECQFWDFNSDKQVNDVDLGSFQEVYLRACITCNDADYDKDGDVDSLDLIQFRSCYNKEFTNECQFWDFNSDKQVNDVDLGSFQEVYLQECAQKICTDSDGGIDYYVKGTTNYNGYDYTDWCVNSTFTANQGTSNEYTLNKGDLVEYACYGDDGQPRCTDTACRFIQYACPNGCENGACVNKTEEDEDYVCTDSDGRKNYYIKGSVTTSSTEFEDRCEPDELLKEYYCQSSEEEGFERYNCPNGCLDGACIFNNDLNPGECYDSDNGKNFIEMGITYDEGEIYPSLDYCDGNRVVEYYCEFDEYRDVYFRKEYIYECKNSCLNGVCLNEQSSLTFNEVVIDAKSLISELNLKIEQIPSEDVIEDINQDLGENYPSISDAYAIEIEAGIDYAVGIFEFARDFKEEEYETISNFFFDEYLAENRCIHIIIKNSVLVFISGPKKDKLDLINSFEKQFFENSLKEFDSKSFICSTQEEPIDCTYGCIKDSNCYPYGYRKGGQYCSENKFFLEYLRPNSDCDNNFECDSNLCVNSKCISGNLWDKIMNFFKRIFMGE